MWLGSLAIRGLRNSDVGTIRHAFLDGICDCPAFAAPSLMGCWTGNDRPSNRLPGTYWFGTPICRADADNSGAFIPFAGAMRADGQIVSIAGYDENEHPQSTSAIALMKAGFVEGARSGEYKATSLVYDVRVELPSTEEKSDAIAVSLNHRDNYSAVLVFPYEINGGELILGAVSAQEGEADIFPAQ